MQNISTETENYKLRKHSFLDWCSNKVLNLFKMKYRESELWQEASSVNLSARCSTI